MFKGINIHKRKGNVLSLFKRFNESDHMIAIYKIKMYNMGMTKTSIKLKDKIIVLELLLFFALIGYRSCFIVTNEIGDLGMDKHGRQILSYKHSIIIYLTIPKYLQIGTITVSLKGFGKNL